EDGHRCAAGPGGRTPDCGVLPALGGATARSAAGRAPTAGPGPGRTPPEPDGVRSGPGPPGAGEPPTTAFGRCAARTQTRPSPGRGPSTPRRSQMRFTEPDERTALREAVAAFTAGYGPRYYREKAKAGAYLSELWAEAGKLGYLGVNIPEEHGGGGGGIGDLAAVLEELSAGGCPTLMMVVSPAICGTVLARFGTDGQRRRWLPGIASGESILAFAITEPDAGSNAHNITTTARRDGGDWLLTGRKTFISGVDVADAVLVVGRTEDARTGRLKPALFIVPTDAPGFEARPIEMDLVSPDHQFGLFMDGVRLPGDALVGDPDSGLL